MAAVAEYPIFEQYTLDELESRTIYSAAYLLAIRDGKKEANPTFRARMAEQLKRSESDLFGKKEAA